jgi:hypothetical protein
MMLVPASACRYCRKPPRTHDASSAGATKPDPLKGAGLFVSLEDRMKSRTGRTKIRWTRSATATAHTRAEDGGGLIPTFEPPREQLSDRLGPYEVRREVNVGYAYSERTILLR